MQEYTTELKSNMSDIQYYTAIRDLSDEQAINKAWCKNFVPNINHSIPYPEPYFIFLN